MWIVNYTRWIMLVSGVLTATMVQAALTPDSALQSNFGETVSGPLAHLVVRNWGALIALVGGMLIYGAFNPLQRFSRADRRGREQGYLHCARPLRGDAVFEPPGGRRNSDRFGDGRSVWMVSSGRAPSDCADRGNAHALIGVGIPAARKCYAFSPHRRKLLAAGKVTDSAVQGGLRGVDA